jgi:hypothetical protein
MRSRKLRGGLAQTRRNLIPLLQNQENISSTLTVKDAKAYLKQDIQESIRVLKSKSDSLDQHDAMLWTDYVNKEMNAMTYMSKGKSMKGLTGAIAVYNAFKQGQDKFRLSLDRQKTPYPCGTVTCKDRGQEMKEALAVLLCMSPDALGQFGLSNAFASAFDWAARSKSQNIDQDYATFMGLPPDLIQDLTVDTEVPAEIELTTTPAQTPLAQTQPLAQDQTLAQAQTPAAQPAKSWFSWSGGRRTRRRYK